MDIEIIKQQREQIKSQILGYQKNIFDLEKELIQLEKQLASFSEETILNTLNLSPQQQAIVDATEDNILVVACPGSGKTHTLISRYVKMVLTNMIKPEETLLITFTKKAGMEMLNRLSNILPSKLPKHTGSLHGFSYKVLQEVNDINYSVLDEKDVKEYLKDLMIDINMKNLEEEEVELIKSKVHMIVDMASSTYPFDIS
jgi:superfamily II DNA or RNA helicase